MKPRHMHWAETLVLVSLVSVTACGFFGSSEDEKDKKVVPTTGGSGGVGGTGGGTATGGTGNPGGTGGTSSTGGAGGAGGAAATGGASGCAGLAGSAMVELSAPNGPKYCMDRTEVTQAQYAEFLKQPGGAPGSEHAECTSMNVTYAPEANSPGPPWEYTKCPSTLWTPSLTPNRPVVCIDWCDAQAYCKWAGKRLCGKVGGGSVSLDPGSITLPNPTDPGKSATASSWFNACSQGGKTIYPYGGAYDPQACLGADSTKLGDGGFAIKEVGMMPGCKGGAPPFASVFDLSGSVAEFTDECLIDSTGPVPTTACAWRGGSYAAPQDQMGCTYYATGDVTRHLETTGFRCCRDLP